MIERARERQAQLTKPPGSLGKLEDIAVWLAGWQGVAKPQINNGQCLVFAGNHGVVAQGVSPFPAEVTAQMVMNFEAGGAAINQLCREAGLSKRRSVSQSLCPARPGSTGGRAHPPRTRANPFATASPRPRGYLLRLRAPTFCRDELPTRVAIF